MRRMLTATNTKHSRLGSRVFQLKAWSSVDIEIKVAVALRMECWVERNTLVVE